MLIIGELINGMYKNVREAIKNKDKAAICKLAMDQITQGSDALDVNTGPASATPVEAMQWLISSIREVTNTPLCIDSTKPDVVEAALKICGPNAIINSTTADDEKLEKLLPLAKKYNASIIGLAMDKVGVPRDAAMRMELAVKIIATCQDAGIDASKIFIDPIVLPVNVAQAQGVEVLESIKQFKIISDPPPKTVVGLSNVSQGAQFRPLINRTFLTMAIACGLDAAILDPLDKDLMDELITAELLLNKHIYCDSYIDAYKKLKSRA